MRTNPARQWAPGSSKALGCLLGAAVALTVPQVAGAQPDAPPAAVQPTAPAPATDATDVAPPVEPTGPAEAAPPESSVPGTAVEAAPMATPPTQAMPQPTAAQPLPPPPRLQQPGTQQPYGGPQYSQGQRPYGRNSRYDRWPRGIDRPFSFTLAVGPGILTWHEDDDNSISEGGLSYGFRFAFGFAEQWSLFMGWDGVVVNRDDEEFSEPARFSQDALSVGLQWFVLEQLHLRGGVSFGTITRELDGLVQEEDDGLGGTFGLGYDVVQGYNYALSVELAMTFLQYRQDLWSSTGFNLALTFF